MTRKIQLLLGAALAMAAASAATAESVRAAAQAAAFAPPAGPMVLTREVRKTFGDGQVFVSRRRYAVRFAPQGEGWTLDGTLIASEVEAPPGVPPQLAELERNRRDDGLFPMHLDGAGMIVDQPGSSDPVTSGRALAAVGTALAGSNLSAADRQAASAFAASLHAQARAAGGNWPPDLFRPRRGLSSETRTMPAGGGAQGRVTIAITAGTGSGGLMERLERRVVTEAGGTSRLSVETWTLVQAR